MTGNERTHGLRRSVQRRAAAAGFRAERLCPARCNETGATMCSETDPQNAEMQETEAVRNPERRAGFQRRSIRKRRL
ncbi:MAG: hypothetical protein IKQ91_09245 [Oscillospiraceae bacterium]|nr:hypothetical protein [Oscillospiraceae bacterium]